MTHSRKLALAYLSMYCGLAICGVSLLGLVGWWREWAKAQAEAAGWRVE